MAEADSKSTELNGEEQVLSSKLATGHSVAIQWYQLTIPQVETGGCVCFLPGEEKEPGEDQHERGDSSASHQGQSRTHDGK